MKDLSNENVIHKIENGISYLQFRRLLEYQDSLTHCFTLRDSDFKSNDTMEEEKGECIENYQKISRILRMDYQNVIRPYQTHTDHIKKVEKLPEKIQIFSEEYQEIDGLITDKRNAVLSLGYADCIPLYFFDPMKKVIANIHSGWKGTLKRIGVKAVEKMEKEYDCNPEEIICCIGPSIGLCHFEVDEDVYQLFHKEFGEIETEVIQKKGNKYHIDTVKINQIILKKAGLKKENIIPSNICSVCHSDVVHSYRADGEKAGRNTAIMMLK